MKKYILILTTIGLFFSCTDWGYKDTGVHDVNRHANKTMYEYFQTDDYNWKLTREMIDKAEIQDIFQGTNAKYKKIMFLGIVNNTIEAWMRKRQYKTLDDVSKEECKNLILSYVFTDIQNREKVPVGKRGQTLDKNQGGIMLTSINGNKVWLYARKDTYQNISSLKITSLISITMNTGNTGYIASSEIIVKNGLVHSLDDGFILGEFK